MPKSLTKGNAILTYLEKLRETTLGNRNECALGAIYLEDPDEYKQILDAVFGTVISEEGMDTGVLYPVRVVVDLFRDSQPTVTTNVIRRHRSGECQACQSR